MKRFIFKTILIWGLLLLFYGTIPGKTPVYASTMDHRFYIKLPDGSREELPGIVIHQVQSYAPAGSAHSTGQKISWSLPRTVFAQFDFCSDENTSGAWVGVRDENFMCGSLASCHAEQFAAPYFPASYNNNTTFNRMRSYEWNYPPSVAEHAQEYPVYQEVSYRHYDTIKTFTQKFPWFPFEAGNPRGSSTAYWAGRVVNGCARGTCVNNPIYFINYGNIPDNPGFGPRFNATTGFNLSWGRLPDYPDYRRRPGSGTSVARWYGPSDKPNWAGNDIAEVLFDPLGGNVYKGSVEWLLVETNPVVLPECGDNACNQAYETCDGNTRCSGSGVFTAGECRAVGTTNECTYCGDGIVQTGEDCDDGNTNNNDTCTNDCENEFLQTTTTTSIATTIQTTTTVDTTTGTTTGTSTGETTSETTTTIEATTSLTTSSTSETTIVTSLPPTGTFDESQDYRVFVGLISLAIGSAIYISNVGERFSTKIAKRILKR